jgi:hypothetical protein
VNLPLDKVVQNDRLQKVLGEIREIPKDQVLNDIKIRADGAAYKAKVSIIPIIDSEATLVETVLVFNRISKKTVQD